jgi:hypothetical protein
MQLKDVDEIYNRTSGTRVQGYRLRR